MKDLFDLRKRVCANCGKHFESNGDYVYKIGNLHKKPKWFCSWRCLQAYRRRAG